MVLLTVLFAGPALATGSACKGSDATGAGPALFASSCALAAANSSSVNSPKQNIYIAVHSGVPQPTRDVEVRCSVTVVVWGNLTSTSRVGGWYPPPLKQQGTGIELPILGGSAASGGPKESPLSGRFLSGCPPERGRRHQ
eukprot:gene1222-biopygen9547